MRATANLTPDRAAEVLDEVATDLATHADAAKLWRDPGGMQDRLAERRLPVAGMPHQGEVVGVTGLDVFHDCFSFRAFGDASARAPTRFFS